MFARAKCITLSVVVLLLIGATGCKNNAEQLSESQKQEFLINGDSIATEAQRVLLSNVTQAMQTSGPAGAVDFCNIHAMPLTDSISHIHSVNIQRLSDKNRNPKNSIDSETDKEAWLQIKQMMKDTAAKQKHLLLQRDNAVYYYKAIPLGMPACLSCHGVKGENILPETEQVIVSKYPDDKATGYSIGELRGIWKIQLSR